MKETLCVTMQCCLQLSFVTMGGSDMLMQGVTCVSMQRQPQRMLKDIKRWYVTCHQCPLSSEGFRGAVKHYANTYLPNTPGINRVLWHASQPMRVRQLVRTRVLHAVPPTPPGRKSPPGRWYACHRRFLVLDTLSNCWVLDRAHD